jgi:hypothetical protein
VNNERILPFQYLRVSDEQLIAAHKVDQEWAKRLAPYHVTQDDLQLALRHAVGSFVKE